MHAGVPPVDGAANHAATTEQSPLSTIRPTPPMPHLLSHPLRRATIRHLHGALKCSTMHMARLNAAPKCRTIARTMLNAKFRYTPSPVRSVLLIHAYA